MMFNGTYNNISAILWQLTLLVEEPDENQKKTTASHWQTLSHNGLPSIPSHVRNSNSQL